MYYLLSGRTKDNLYTCFFKSGYISGIQAAVRYQACDLVDIYCFFDERFYRKFS